MASRFRYILNGVSLVENQIKPYFIHFRKKKDRMLQQWLQKNPEYLFDVDSFDIFQSIYE